MEKFIIHSNSKGIYAMLDELPYPNEGTANKALKKAGFDPKKIGGTFEFFFVLDSDIGSAIRVRFEKFVTPRNRVEIYVTQKEWLTLERDYDGLLTC